MKRIVGVNVSNDKDFIPPKSCIQQDRSMNGHFGIGSRRIKKNKKNKFNWKIM